jgi:preprotein translocase subunit SecD
MSQRYKRLSILILILILVAVFIVWPNSAIRFNQFGIQVDRSFETKYGLDLVGGIQALLEADVPADTPVDAQSMSTAKTIVENRVNGLLGVTEALVQSAGDRRILVEIPGETDPDTAFAAIKQTGLLEFVDFSALTYEEVLQLQQQNVKIRTDYIPTSGDSSTSPITGTQTTTPTQSSTIFHTVMAGTALSNVGVTTDPQTGEYLVAFELKGDARNTFADFTTNNIGKILAIVLDGQIISAPSIQNPITDGQGVITGNFTNESANALAVQLRYGSLPVPLKIASSETVGPTLGKESLQQSLVAGVIGLIIVILFMGLYYRLPGILADIALLVYTLLTLAIFKLIPVTLTLPGIAGFVLSIGVAVDANVLIFERMKEELRAGRTLRQAIDIGWSRAWLSIRDSNLSTLITCLILYIFGNTFGASIVKGFSVTLAIGVGVSMFTAIVVTRTFLHLIMDRIDFSTRKSWFNM